MKLFRVEARLHIVDYIEAKTKNDAINEFISYLEWSGECYDQTLNVECVDEKNKKD